MGRPHGAPVVTVSGASTAEGRRGRGTRKIYDEARVAAWPQPDAAQPAAAGQPATAAAQAMVQQHPQQQQQQQPVRREQRRQQAADNGVDASAAAARLQPHAEMQQQRRQPPSMPQQQEAQSGAQHSVLAQGRGAPAAAPQGQPLARSAPAIEWDGSDELDDWDAAGAASLLAFQLGGLLAMYSCRSSAEACWYGDKRDAAWLSAQMGSLQPRQQEVRLEALPRGRARCGRALQLPRRGAAASGGAPSPARTTMTQGRTCSRTLSNQHSAAALRRLRMGDLRLAALHSWSRPHL